MTVPQGKTRLTIDIDTALHKRLKALSVEQGVSIVKLVSIWIEQGVLYGCGDNT